MNMKNQSSDAPALTGEQNSRFLVEMSHFFCLPSVTDEGEHKHRTTEYPQGSSSPNPGLSQDYPKNPTLCLTALSQCS